MEENTICILLLNFKSTSVPSRYLSQDDKSQITIEHRPKLDPALDEILIRTHALAANPPKISSSLPIPTSSAVTFQTLSNPSVPLLRNLKSEKESLDSLQLSTTTKYIMGLGIM
ncbi:uncharacterized protein EAF02_009807 [Botrytis sinoallii]|uniref:uncharacterized protein n=1 Tax=Botrytis sinoallii TaxID=1463999 RepID=UPI001900A502|nr:uncharacterized protein EAF02_009807 [Botrytis sinoallii]KAF7867021.1 hypothetical protein EAF02_009807 [Botrytis sinoallii]